MRWFVPEVIQTSAMDCGPASVKALMEGFGLPISYGRLREACHTDVDGTSIDCLEEAAAALGLDASQMMVPVDDLLLGAVRLLPALVVVRMPSGLTHFVVAWRRVGGLVQVMDPSIGRRWVSVRRFLADVYRHTQAVPAAAWRDWARSDGNCRTLRRRMRRLGLSSGESAARIAAASRDPSWRGFAALDAAARMLESLAASRALGRGRTMSRMLSALTDDPGSIPGLYWSVKANPASPDEIAFTGAVFMHVRGRTKSAPENLTPELAAALKEPPASPARDMWNMVSRDSRRAAALVLAALALAALAVTFEALLFRGLFGLGLELRISSLRWGAAAGLALFLGLVLAFETTAASVLARMGRKLEIGLRVAFLRKIPRLDDRYFQSRLISDMAERSHTAFQLRTVPELAAGLLRPLFEVICTVGAIAWLYPGSSAVAALAGLAAVAVPLLAQPALISRDLRLRTHAGALSRFYLDALLGLTAIRAHAADRAVRRENEHLLAEWAHAGLSLQRTATVVEGAQLAATTGLVVWLLLGAMGVERQAGGLLLLVYWALRLPMLGQDIGAAARRYPWLRNVALRLLEPLGAPDARQAGGGARQPGPEQGGARLVLEGVSVRAAGHPVLHDVSLEIQPGAHLAIVGPSGAGKSSLVGLLLGWHRPAAGRVLVDGAPLDAPRLEALRREIAWVDPQVYLWNRSLLENLRFGARDRETLDLEGVLDRADLKPVVGRLPDGLETVLGEAGALVSGGEGQRVRLGRGMLKPGVRLAILDEPARGLDRSRRTAMLDAARRMWGPATLIAITHDVASTLAFERVLVMDHGRIVEDGEPRRLAADPGSRFRALLDAEESVRQGLWSNGIWRRLELQGGRLSERPSGEASCRTR